MNKTLLLLALTMTMPLTVTAQTSPSADKQPDATEKKYLTSSEYLTASGILIPPAPEKFNHPGLLSDLAELHKIRDHIKAGREPWKSAFEHLKKTPWADLKYRPKPRESVVSGFLGSGGEAGGASDLGRDGKAAYAHALMWVFTGDERHAAKAAEILNAWTVLKKFGGGNWYMMAQWDGSLWPLSAEIIRATYPVWTKAEQDKFSAMLSETFLPVLHNRLSYGNREFGVINAMMAIGVFNNDRAAVTEALHHWVSYVPNWIYLKSDGPDPIAPDYPRTSPSNDQLAALDSGLFPDVKKSWIYRDEEVRAWMKENKMGDDKSWLGAEFKPSQHWHRAPAEAFVDGLCGETFRDLGHCDLGFAQLINTAEIAWHQGIDLYAIHAKRIVAFMELYANLRIGEPLPKVFWGVTPLGMNATFEIAYNHYHNRMGVELPNTRRLIEEHIRASVNKTPVISDSWCYVNPDPGIRASQITYPAVLCIAWETLLHAEIGGEKTPPPQAK